MPRTFDGVIFSSEVTACATRSVNLGDMAFRIEAVPLGTFFVEVHPGLYVPAGHEVTPLGAETTVKVDFQLISASHRNLVARRPYQADVGSGRRHHARPEGPAAGQPQGVGAARIERDRLLGDEGQVLTAAQLAALEPDAGR